MSKSTATPRSATPRSKQVSTLKMFARRKVNGFTIGEMAKKLDIHTGSARSRILRCFENGWLTEVQVEGPTGPMRRFHLSDGGKKAIAAA